MGDGGGGHQQPGRDAASNALTAAAPGGLAEPPEVGRSAACPGDRRDLHGPPGGRSPAGQPFGGEVGQPFGRAQRPRAVRGRGCGAPVGVEQVLQQRGDQQRAAPRPVRRSTGAQDGWTPGGSSAATSASSHGRSMITSVRAAAAQVRDRRAQRRALLGVAVGRDHQHPGPVRGQRRAAAGSARPPSAGPPARRRSGPRPARRAPPRRPAGARPGRPARPRPGSAVSGSGRGERHQPGRAPDGRRSACSHGHSGGAPSSGSVRPVSTVTPPRRGLTGERVDQPGLADPRLAPHEHGPSAAGERGAQHPERRVPPDQRACAQSGARRRDTEQPPACAGGRCAGAGVRTCAGRPRSRG